MHCFANRLTKRKCPICEALRLIQYLPGIRTHHSDKPTTHSFYSNLVKQTSKNVQTTIWEYAILLVVFSLLTRIVGVSRLSEALPRAIAFNRQRLQGIQRNPKELREAILYEAKQMVPHRVKGQRLRALMDGVILASPVHRLTRRKNQSD